MMGWPAFMHECVIVPYHHCLTIFWQEQRFSSWKTVKNAFFQLFYGILRPFTALKWELNTTLCFETLMYVYLGSNFPFSGSFRVIDCLFTQEKQKKMVKNVILTAFYGIKWYWIITGWPEFMHVCVLVPDYHCLTIFWP